MQFKAVSPLAKLKTLRQRRLFFTSLLLLLFIVATAVAFVLMKNSQDIRQQASGPIYDICLEPINCTTERYCGGPMELVECTEKTSLTKCIKKTYCNYGCQNGQCIGASATPTTIKTPTPTKTTTPTPPTVTIATPAPSLFIQGGSKTPTPTLAKPGATNTGTTNVGGGSRTTQSEVASFDFSKYTQPTTQTISVTLSPVPAEMSQFFPTGYTDYFNYENDRQVILNNQAKVDPILDSKGITAAVSDGERNVQSVCTGVWMNNFCYLIGDKVKGGWIVVPSAPGRNYPHLVKEEVYASPTFNQVTVQQTLGNTGQLGEGCNGKGLAVNGTCYAYGSTVNGYLVMGPRTAPACDNATKNYCYPHLQKIAVDYSSWNSAKSSYEKQGDLTALETLYQQKYGVAFNSDNLFDPSAPNAEALRAQALLAALTSSEVLKTDLERQNQALVNQVKPSSSSGVSLDFNVDPILLMTPVQKAQYEANLKAMTEVDRYFFFDSIARGTITNTVQNQVINEYSQQLITSKDDAELSAVAEELFEKIYGYPSDGKYVNLQGLINNGLGLDISTLREQRAEYARQVAAAEAESQAQQTEFKTSLAEAVKDPSFDLHQLLLSNPELWGGRRQDELYSLTNEQILALFGLADQTKEILEARKLTIKQNSLLAKVVDPSKTLREVLLNEPELWRGKTGDFYALNDQEILDLLGLTEYEEQIFQKRQENALILEVQSLVANGDSAGLKDLLRREKDMSTSELSYYAPILSSSEEILKLLLGEDKGQLAYEELLLNKYINYGDLNTPDSNLKELLAFKYGEEEAKKVIAHANFSGLNVNQAILQSLTNDQQYQQIERKKTADLAKNAFLTGDKESFVNQCQKLEINDCASDTFSAFENVLLTINPNLSAEQLAQAVEQNLRQIDNTGFQIDATRDYTEEFCAGLSGQNLNRCRANYNVLIGREKTIQDTLKNNFSINERNIADYVFANENAFSTAYVEQVRLNDLLDDNLIFDRQNNKYDLSEFSFAERATAGIFQGLESLHSNTTRQYIDVAVNYNPEGDFTSTDQRDIFYASAALGGQIAADIALVAAPFGIGVIGAGAAIPVISVTTGYRNFANAVSNMGNTCLSGTEKECSSAQINVGIAAAGMAASVMGGSQMMANKAINAAQQGVNSGINTLTVASNNAGNLAATSNTLINFASNVNPLITSGAGLAVGAASTIQSLSYMNEVCALNPNDQSCNQAKLNFGFALSNVVLNGIFGFGEQAFNYGFRNVGTYKNIDLGLDIVSAITGAGIDAQSALNQCLEYDDPSSCVNAVLAGVSSLLMDTESISMRLANERANRQLVSNTAIDAQKIPDYNEDFFSQRLTEEYHAELSGQGQRLLNLRNELAMVNVEIENMRSSIHEASEVQELGNLYSRQAELNAKINLETAKNQKYYDNSREIIGQKNQIDQIDAEIEAKMRNFSIDQTDEIDNLVIQRQTLADELAQKINNNLYGVEEIDLQQKALLVDINNKATVLDNYQQIKNNALVEAELLAKLPTQEAADYKKPTGLAEIIQGNSEKNRILETLALDQKLNEVQRLSAELESGTSTRDPATIETEINNLKQEIADIDPRNKGFVAKTIETIFASKEQRARNDELVAMIDLRQKRADLLENNKQLLALEADPNRDENQLLALKKQNNQLQTEITELDNYNQQIKSNLALRYENLKPTIVERITDSFDNIFGSGPARRATQKVAEAMSGANTKLMAELNSKSLEITDLEKQLAEISDLAVQKEIADKIESTKKDLAELTQQTRQNNLVKTIQGNDIEAIDALQTQINKLSLELAVETDPVKRQVIQEQLIIARDTLIPLRNNASSSDLATVELIAQKRQIINDLETRIKQSASDVEIADLNNQLSLATKTLNDEINASFSYTRIEVTEAGRQAGIKDKDLALFNETLQKFEQYKRQEIPGFKIYAGTDTFKDQDLFLLAELESFGSNSKGAVFGALPGMGKTDVVMPFNVVMKQKMTDKPQFVVFPEAKLAKPWTSDDQYTPNKAFIDFVESDLGEGSVLIVRPNEVVDPAIIAKAKIIITTKDVAFDLKSTDTDTGLALRNKWRDSYVHADEVHWTFNPMENYLTSGAQTRIVDRADFALYLEAQKAVLGIDENGQPVAGGLTRLNELIAEASVSKVVPDGVAKNSDGQGGHYSEGLEKEILVDWIEKNWSAEQRQALGDNPRNLGLTELQGKINDFLGTDSSEAGHALKAQLTVINKAADILAAVPGTDYGLSDKGGFSSIAPREESRVSGRSYSALSEQLLYNSVGAKILGVNDQIDIKQLSIGESGNDINYAQLMLESRGFSLYTGTPETVSSIFKMAYNIDLKTYSDSALDAAIGRFTSSDSKMFASIADQASARQGENRNPVYINLDKGQKSNEATLNEVAQSLPKLVDAEGNEIARKMFIIGANGELIEGSISAGKFTEVDRLASIDDLNARTKALDNSDERYVKFYEFGAHTGVDTKNNVDISRAIGICRNCDATTFSQGINRVRVDVDPSRIGAVEKFAPIDIIHLDAEAGKTINIENFVATLTDNQVKNQAISEVQFKETLLRNSANSTLVDLIDLAKNGRRGPLGIKLFGADPELVKQLENIQQKWKEVSEMSYRLGSNEIDAEAKLGQVADQVAGLYKELEVVLDGSGAPASLLAERGVGAIGKDVSTIAFGEEVAGAHLGENPSFRDIVNLINQSSKHLEDSNIVFTQRGVGQTEVQREIVAANPVVKPIANEPVATEKTPAVVDPASKITATNIENSAAYQLGQNVGGIFRQTLSRINNLFTNPTLESARDGARKNSQRTGDLTVLAEVPAIQSRLNNAASFLQNLIAEPAVTLWDALWGKQTENLSLVDESALTAEGIQQTAEEQGAEEAQIANLSNQSKTGLNDLVDKLNNLETEADQLAEQKDFYQQRSSEGYRWTEENISPQQSTIIEYQVGIVDLENKEVLLEKNIFPANRSTDPATGKTVLSKSSATPTTETEVKNYDEFLTGVAIEFEKRYGISYEAFIEQELRFNQLLASMINGDASKINFFRNQLLTIDQDPDSSIFSFDLNQDLKEFLAFNAKNNDDDAQLLADLEAAIGELNQLQLKTLSPELINQNLLVLAGVVQPEERAIVSDQEIAVQENEVAETVAEAAATQRSLAERVYDLGRSIGGFFSNIRQTINDWFAEEPAADLATTTEPSTQTEEIEVKPEEIEEANQLLADQQRYQQLRDQFKALNTTSRVINDESDYQNELVRLNQAVQELEILQRESGLKFVETDVNGKIATTENGLYELKRTAEFSNDNLSTFKRRAELLKNKVITLQQTYQQQVQTLIDLSNEVKLLLGPGIFETSLKDINLFQERINSVLAERTELEALQNQMNQLLNDLGQAQTQEITTLLSNLNDAKDKLLKNIEIIENKKAELVTLYNLLDISPELNDDQSMQNLVAVEEDLNEKIRTKQESDQKIAFLKNLLPANTDLDSLSPNQVLVNIFDQYNLADNISDLPFSRENLMVINFMENYPAIEEFLSRKFEEQKDLLNNLNPSSSLLTIAFVDLDYAQYSAIENEIVSLQQAKEARLVAEKAQLAEYQLVLQKSSSLLEEIAKILPGNLSFSQLSRHSEQLDGFVKKQATWLDFENQLPAQEGDQVLLSTIFKTMRNFSRKLMAVKEENNLLRQQIKAQLDYLKMSVADYQFASSTEELNEQLNTLKAQVKAIRDQQEFSTNMTKSFNLLIIEQLNSWISIAQDSQLTKTELIRRVKEKLSEQNFKSSAEEKIKRLISDELSNHASIELTDKQKNSIQITLLNTFLGFDFIEAITNNVQEVKTADQRILAVGDVHGDFTEFFNYITGQVTGQNGQTIDSQLIYFDKNGQWIGGNNRLIQMGDLFDRTPENQNGAETAAKVMTLQKAAGIHPDGQPKLLVLLGNHDINALHALKQLDFVLEKLGLSSLDDLASINDPRQRKILQGKINLLSTLLVRGINSDQDIEIIEEYLSTTDQELVTIAEREQILFTNQLKDKLLKIAAKTRMSPGIRVDELETLYRNPDLVSWLKQLPAMFETGGELYFHSDSNAYLNYGQSVPAINTKITNIIQSGTFGDYSKLLSEMTNRSAFRNQTDILGQQITKSAQELVDDFLGKLNKSLDTKIIHAHSEGQSTDDDRVSNVDGGLSEHYRKKPGRGAKSNVSVISGQSELSFKLELDEINDLGLQDKLQEMLEGIEIDNLESLAEDTVFNRLEIKSFNLATLDSFENLVQYIAHSPLYSDLGYRPALLNYLIDDESDPVNLDSTLKRVKERFKNISQAERQSILLSVLKLNDLPILPSRNQVWGLEDYKVAGIDSTERVAVKEIIDAQDRYGKELAHLSRSIQTASDEEYRNIYQRLIALAKKMGYEVIGAEKNSQFATQFGLVNFYNPDQANLPEEQRHWNLVREGLSPKKFLEKQKPVLYIATNHGNDISPDNIYHFGNRRNPSDDPLMNFVHDLGAMALGGKAVAANSTAYLKPETVSKLTGFSENQLVDLGVVDQKKQMVSTTWLFDGIIAGRIQPLLMESRPTTWYPVRPNYERHYQLEKNTIYSLSEKIYTVNNSLVISKNKLATLVADDSFDFLNGDADMLKVYFEQGQWYLQVDKAEPVLIEPGDINMLNLEVGFKVLADQSLEITVMAEGPFEHWEDLETGILESWENESFTQTENPEQELEIGELSLINQDLFSQFPALRQIELPKIEEAGPAITLLLPAQSQHTLDVLNQAAAIAQATQDRLVAHRQAVINEQNAQIIKQQLDLRRQQVLSIFDNLALPMMDGINQELNTEAEIEQLEGLVTIALQNNYGVYRQLDQSFFSYLISLKEEKALETSNVINWTEFDQRLERERQNNQAIEAQGASQPLLLTAGEVINTAAEVIKDVAAVAVGREIKPIQEEQIAPSSRTPAQADQFLLVWQALTHDELNLALNQAEEDKTKILSTLSYLSEDLEKEQRNFVNKFYFLIDELNKYTNWFNWGEMESSIAAAASLRDVFIDQLQSGINAFKKSSLYSLLNQQQQQMIIDLTTKGNQYYDYLLNNSGRTIRVDTDEHIYFYIKPLKDKMEEIITSIETNTIIKDLPDTQTKISTLTNPAFDIFSTFAKNVSALGSLKDNWANLDYSNLLAFVRFVDAFNAQSLIDNYELFISTFNNLINRVENELYFPEIWYEDASYADLKAIVARRQEYYLAQEASFAKLDDTRKIENERQLTSGIEDLDNLIKKIQAKENELGEQFFIDEPKAVFDDLGELVNYSFAVNSKYEGRASYFLNLTKEELEQLDNQAQSKSDTEDSKFGDLCSSCSDIRDQTRAGVEAADESYNLAQAKMSEIVTLHIQLSNLPNNRANRSQVKELKAQVKTLEQEKEKAIQEALSKLKETERTIVNQHNMQNQCVQTYLNAWVYTRIAEIKPTRSSIRTAINSVFTATQIAEEILATKTDDSTPATMTYVAKQGFLGGIFGIGRQMATVELTDEDYSDVEDMLNGNSAKGVRGLKEMAEFRVDEEGELRKEVIQKRTHIENWQKSQNYADQGGEENQIIATKPVKTLIDEYFSPSEKLLRDYFEVLEKLGFAEKNDDGQIRLDLENIKTIDFQLDFSFLNWIKEVNPDLTAMVNQYWKYRLDSKNMPIQAQQVFINRLLASENKLYFNLAGQNVSFADYLKSVYGETVDTIIIESEYIDEETFEKIIRNKNINDIPKQSIDNLRDSIRDIPITYILVQANNQELKIPIFALDFGENFSHGNAFAFDNGDGLNPIFINNKLNTRSMFSTIATIAHETDHALHKLLNPTVYSLDTSNNESAASIIEALFRDRAYESKTIEKLADENIHNYENKNKINLDYLLFFNSLITEMGGEAASIRFYNAFASGLNNFNQDYFKLVNLVLARDYEMTIYRIDSIEDVNYVPYALGRILYLAIKNSYGEKEFLRILNKMSLQEVVSLFRDIKESGLENLIADRDLIEKYDFYFDTGEMMGLGTMLFNFDEWILEKNQKRVVQDEKDQYQYITDLLQSNLGQFEIFSTIFKTIYNLFPKQTIDWIDNIVALYEITSILADENILFRQYYANDPDKTDASQEVYADLSQHLDLLFLIYESKLHSSIFQSKELRRFIFDLAYKRMVKQQQSVADLKPFVEELEKMVVDLAGETVKFDNLTGLNLQLPVFYDADKNVFLNQEKYAELKEKIALLKQYYPKIQDKTIFLDLSDDPSLDEVQSRINLELERVNNAENDNLLNFNFNFNLNFS